jgi:hypothetical protein
LVLYYYLYYLYYLFYLYLFLKGGGDIMMRDSNASECYSNGGNGGFLTTTGQGCFAVTGCNFTNITQKGEDDNSGGKLFFYVFYFIDTHTGGVFYVNDGSDDVTIKDCNFEKCSAEGGRRGGIEVNIL